ncbi:MAG: hypothetical protein CMJ25_07980 [Phycisphaerae bacterium]|nr:hypothetical protein [Phycisphaerae bacterium]
MLFQQHRFNAGEPATKAATDQCLEPLPARARVVIRNKVAAGADPNQGRAAVDAVQAGHAFHMSHSIMLVPNPHAWCRVVPYLIGYHA